LFLRNGNKNRVEESLVPRKYIENTFAAYVAGESSPPLKDRHTIEKVTFEMLIS